MDVDEFLRHYRTMQFPLAAWGEFVRQTVGSRAEETGTRIQFSSSRLKTAESALGKIVRKRYSNPITEMDDLFGVRIVVLLREDIEKLTRVIENTEEWAYSKERDPEEEAARDPHRFDYRSVHYVITAPADRVIDGVDVLQGTRCEVQLRTILEHAYAEVTHDSVYKSPWKAPVKAARYLASSSALIETTEHLFSETMRVLNEESLDRGEFLNELASIYQEQIGAQGGFDNHLNMAVLAEYRDQLPENAHVCLDEFMAENEFIVSKVKSRLTQHPFWRQPVALLSYWLVSKHPSSTIERWPFAGSVDPLELVYSDMGIAPRH